MIAPVDHDREKHEGRRVVIVGTAPSYDDIDPALYDGECVFALNFAITEFQRHPDCWWVCHDLWTCWPRYRMPQRLRGYRWRLVTRRVYFKGALGAADWRQKGGARIRRPFPWRIDPPRGAEVRWYSEFEDQPGYVRNGNTVLELALEVATIWGFAEAVVVGADMQKVDGRAYGAPWNDWKPCKIKPPKFEEMRESLRRNRRRWPLRVRNLSPHWQSPFENEALSCE